MVGDCAHIHKVPWRLGEPIAAAHDTLIPRQRALESGRAAIMRPGYMTQPSERKPESATGAHQRRHITVEGIVQGVGFRPFVHRLAQDLGLVGRAHNFTGGLAIEVQGPPDAVDRFVTRLTDEAPPVAVIEGVEVTPAPLLAQTDFRIVASREEEGGPIFVSPDVAICEDCLREMRDPADRRYRHPFINCTNCGPRFTIVSQVPYDRPNTSMGDFPMCEQCRAEYEDIGDRRYHAQPVACPNCGPTLLFVAVEGAERGEQALAAAREMLLEGGIVAIKGLGGFHLACDADDEAAVRRLKQRKDREAKPLAVMAESLAVAAQFSEITPEAAELLESPQSPITLVQKGEEAPLAPAIAPDTDTYGLMLPYTPLHALLLEGLGPRALVMTSGNLSDEPLCIDNEEAQERLAGIADGFLIHDRDIYVGCDDSVVRPTRRGPILFRRARGYVPFPVRLGHEMRPLLAMGGHLKNTFCIANGRNAFLSQHLGDLADQPTLEFFERSLEHFESLLQVTPEALACDLHPDYLSTRHAELLSAERGLPLFRVQHHHAHFAACLADNHETRPAVGLICDGTGYGEDGTIWGCEVLVGDAQDYERAGHLRYVPLPGGERAIEEPWRMAAAYLREAFGPGFADEVDVPFVEQMDRAAWELLEQMIERGLNCPQASSAGRLFDAVAALIGLHATVDYEGQAAIHLEAVAEAEGQPYDFALVEGDEGFIIDPLPTIRDIVSDLQRGATTSEIASRFHGTFIRMLAEAAERAARQHGLDLVALSGGTFQNAIVVEQLMPELERRNLRPLIHTAAPPGDGGLSLGQALVAHARWD